MAALLFLQYDIGDAVDRRPLLAYDMPHLFCLGRSIAGHTQQVCGFFLFSTDQYIPPSTQTVLRAEYNLLSLCMVTPLDQSCCNMAKQ